MRFQARGLCLARRDLGHTHGAAQRRFKPWEQLADWPRQGQPLHPSSTETVIVGVTAAGKATKPG
jgi:hypothetical protein